MDETVRAGRADYVLLMDDDVQLDPEGILRAATFADLARRPTIVGGHMFSMYDRSVLHAFAETVAPHNWWWGPRRTPRPGTTSGGGTCGTRPWLHRRADVGLQRLVDVPDPDQVIARARPRRCRCSSSGTTPSTGCGPAIAASRRCRCRAWRPGRCRGRTRTTPGLAGVLPPAQPARRRAAALARAPRRRRHLREPGAAAAEPAVHAVLDRRAAAAGDRGRAHRPGAHAPGDRDQDERSCGRSGRRITDAQGRGRPGKLPAAAAQGPGRAEAVHHPDQQVQPDDQGRGRHRAAVQAAAAKGARKRPQMALPYQDAGWWVLAKLDSALVSAADGTTAAWYQRDPKLFRSLGWRSVVAAPPGCAGSGPGWPRSTAPRRPTSPRPSGGGRPSRRR